jgi:hypothetical protein
MTLSIWILLGVYIIGVAPFAVVAAYFVERRRARAQALTAAQAALADLRADHATALAGSDVLIAERDAALRACAELQAQVRQAEEALGAQLAAQAAERAGADLALCHVVLTLQRSLAISRTEVLRLDTELRRRPASERVPVTVEEWANIVAAAHVQASRRAVARAVFGNSGKHTYSKVKHVCDAEGLLLPDAGPVRTSPDAPPAGVVSEEINVCG